MKFFIYGPDTFRAKRKIEGIIESCKKKYRGKINLKIFDQDKEIKFEDFQKELFSSSIFGEKKLIFLKNVFSNSQFKEEFIKNINKIKISENLILIYEERDILEKEEFLKILKKSFECQKFDFLDGNSLRIWVDEEFKRQKIKIEWLAREKLIEFIGNDCWHLSNEIQKLINYKKGEPIFLKDVLLLIKPQIKSDIFKTIDAIAEKNKIAAFKYLHYHLEKGDNPGYLISMLVFQFRNLLILKNFQLQKGFNFQYWNQNSLAKKLNLHPYILKKSFFQVQRFKINDLERIYRRIFYLDWQIKTGKIKPALALDLFLAEI